MGGEGLPPCYALFFVSVRLFKVDFIDSGELPGDAAKIGAQKSLNTGDVQAL
jgi:hypothetical protein